MHWRDGGSAAHYVRGGMTNRRRTLFLRRPSFSLFPSSATPSFRRDAKRRAESPARQGAGRREQGSSGAACVHAIGPLPLVPLQMARGDTVLLIRLPFRQRRQELAEPPTSPTLLSSRGTSDDGLSPDSSPIWGRPGEGMTRLRVPWRVRDRGPSPAMRTAKEATLPSVANPSEASIHWFNAQRGQKVTG